MYDPISNPSTCIPRTSTWIDTPAQRARETTQIGIKDVFAQADVEAGWSLAASVCIGCALVCTGVVAFGLECPVSDFVWSVPEQTLD